MPTVAIVCTNTNKLPKSGLSTGWFLPEVAHPYHVFKKEGFDVIFASPNGGDAPVDKTSVTMYKSDKECCDFLNNHEICEKLKNTKKVAELKPSDVDLIFFAGGHGTMFDFPTEEIGSWTASMYKNRKVIGAVCHGPAVFVNCKLPDGRPLVSNKAITSFTNREENDIPMYRFDLPFFLQTRLSELGANFHAGTNWSNHVHISGRLVTGQNPQSAATVAKEMINVYRNKPGEDYNKEIYIETTTSKIRKWIPWVIGGSILCIAAIIVGCCVMSSMEQGEYRPSSKYQVTKIFEK